MPVRVVEEAASALPEYGQVPIAFRVEFRFRVEPVQGGLGGLLLIEEPVAPFIKDYDAIPGEGPSTWAKRWDLSNWGIFGAFEAGLRVGGAAVAWNTAGLNMLQGRGDLAALWDVRVDPDHRRRGVGERLFEAAVAWARERGCRRLIVETQNVNVPACRFYARQGCELAGIDRNAYPSLPEEARVVWCRDL